MLESYYLSLGTLAAVILAGIYVYFKICHSYWQRQGVPTLPTSLPFGSFQDVMLSRTDVNNQSVYLYNAFEGHKVGGLYTFHKASLLIRDPEVIKEVLVRDFSHFRGRGYGVNKESQVLLDNLFLLSGSKWKTLRAKLTPTFTSGKMKMMFETLVDCGKGLQTCLEKPARDGEVIEIKDILSRYTTDVIASCAFGIQCNCLANPNADFRNWGRKFVTPTYRHFLVRLFQYVVPSLVWLLGIRLITKDVSHYFRKMVRETVEYREKNNVKRDDFMQLLIQMKNKTLGEEEDDGTSDGASFEVTMDTMAAQAFMFFVAGFDTSSTTMTFCLYEMALNQDIQQRVRLEMDLVIEHHGGQLTYESMLEMEYLDKVVNETLRKYPPVPILRRECTKDTKISGTNAVARKGMLILCPVLAIHHDPKYYPDPKKFDPERFSKEEAKKRPSSTFLAFGDGPRMCLGMRFGLMQTKVGLISLLSKYEVHPSAKTPVPLVFDSNALALYAKGGVWLKLVERTDM